MILIRLHLFVLVCVLCIALGGVMGAAVERGGRGIYGILSVLFWITIVGGIIAILIGGLFYLFPLFSSTIVSEFGPNYDPQDRMAIEAVLSTWKSWARWGFFYVGVGILGLFLCRMANRSR